ncbi:hypothetical protein DDE82_000896 [Stemphylium lycopersici]|uniref:F-box domain-containing protein n=1 Tax=Stemphylium lycopersici TaxID=183478 RepID=A0A364NEN1_STELY|nr:f-box domain-containing protein [Stemphylium lycopersici]RAR10924.1 hypothetical protein DDE82_000896 [Stemphylium lycopersici]RAR15667.1 hypothetical protein DDE83_000899 [Stemphylium lycopersici]
MSPHLLSLPTEILNHILCPLPLQSLLRFSETCLQARDLANASLHTLSLGIAPLCPFKSILTIPSLPPTPPTSINSSSSASTSASTSSSTAPPSQPYAIWFRIPSPSSHTYLTLLTFQSALVTSILLRHGTMLQTLHLSIWALTVPLASALRSLTALKSLSLRIESGSHGRGVPRSCRAVERDQQAKAWVELTEREVPPSWSQRLVVLRLENAGVGARQLGRLLAETRACREVVLDGCRYLGSEFWHLLRQWEGRSALEVLEVAGCGGILGEGAVGAIGELEGLERLNLYDCEEQESGLLERWNRDKWHISDFVAPRPKAYGADMVIEVDPAYVQ